MNKQNPNNSSVIQCLLDIEKAAKTSDNSSAPYIQKAAMDLRKMLTKDIIAESDKIYNAHRHNSSKITFAKMANFKTNQAISRLSDRACKILMYGIQIMSRDNCFLIYQDNLTKTLNMSIKTVNRGIKELVENGCMTKICTLQRKKPSGTVYMINPEIASIGSHNNIDFYEKMTPDEQLDNFDVTSYCAYDVIHATIPLANRTISFNYENIVTDEMENVNG